MIVIIVLIIRIVYLCYGVLDHFNILLTIVNRNYLKKTKSEKGIDF